MTTANNIAQAFGLVLSDDNLEIIEGDIVQEEVEEGPVNVHQRANDDYDFARAQLRKLIEDGMVTALDASSVARQSQNSNTYAAAAQVMKTMIDANKELLDLSKKRNDISTQTGTKDKPTVTNNNLFVGNTTELIKMIKDTKKDEQ